MIPIYDGSKHIWTGGDDCEVMGWRNKETAVSSQPLRNFVYGAGGNVIRARDDAAQVEATVAMIERIRKRVPSV